VAQPALGIEAIIKMVGSIIGPAIQLFTRGRPKAEVVVKKFGANPYTSVHIKNPGPGGMLIKEVHVEPPIYAVAKDDSATAIRDAAFLGINASITLGPGEERDLPIIDRRIRLGISKDGPSQTVRFAIYWRKTSSTWLWRLPVWIMTSTHDIQQQEDVTTPWHGASSV
jgi:hypothetical protein